MKKLILTLLTLATLTACKKDIVEPVVDGSETSINRLPKRVYQDSTLLHEYKYYSNGLVKEISTFNFYGVDTSTSTFYYEKGRLVKREEVGALNQTLAFNYENDKISKFKIVFRNYGQYSVTNYDFIYTNGNLDFITKFDSTVNRIDTIMPFVSHALSKTNDSIIILIQNDEKIKTENSYLTKRIEIQFDVASSIMTLPLLKLGILNNKYLEYLINSNVPYNYCLSIKNFDLDSNTPLTVIKFDYSFDKYDRLINIYTNTSSSFSNKRIEY